MKATKRFLSAIMAMTMVCGTAVSVSAQDVTSFGEGSSTASDSTSGNGALEGYANKDVLCVVLPTTTVDFIVDPQGLIKDSIGATGAAANTKYKNAEWDFKVSDADDAAEKDDGFIFFATPKMEGTKQVGTTYSTYKKLKVENKSSYNVTVTPSIAYADGKVAESSQDGFGLLGQTGSTEFAANSTNLVAFALSSTEAAPLNGVPAAYEVKYGKTGYTYELNQTTYATLAEDSSTGNVLEVTITGASNPNATNWAAVNKTISDNAKNKNKVDPKVTVTWTIAKATT